MVTGSRVNFSLISLETPSNHLHENRERELVSVGGGGGGGWGGGEQLGRGGDELSRLGR